MAAWQAAAVALAIGLLIGSERERSGHGGREAGVRTFALAALAGCLAGLAGVVPLAATVAAAGALVTVGYARTSVKDPGLTTETALVLTVVLGGLAAHRPALAAGAAVAATVVLLSKQRLHRFVRDTVTDVEVADALKFFVVAFVVLPLVPHARLGPYGVVDPRRIWIIVVAVTALGWLGYLAVRLLGADRGLPVAGLAGGFISGSATTGAMARQARSPHLRRPGLAAALLASVATLIQLVLVTAVVDRRVALLLAPAAGLGAVVLAVEGWVLVWRRASRPAPQPPAGLAGPDGEDRPDPATPAPAPAPAPAEPARRPFALLPALVLAGVLTAFLVLASFAEERFGARGSVFAIAVAGLADAHAGALTAASLAALGRLSPEAAVLAAMAAVGVNTVVKLVLAFAAGGRRVFATFALLLVAPTAAVSAAVALVLALSR